MRSVVIVLLVCALTACSKPSSTVSANAAGNATPNTTVVPPPEPVQPTVQPKPAVVIPAGTRLRVTLLDSVSSDKSRTGDHFAASLAEPVVIDGEAVLRKGTRLRGRVVEAKGSGRVKGRASIELRLTELTFNDGKSVEIVTKTYSAVAQATKKRDAAIIGGGAGLGAVIGAIAGGGKGALLGAAVGGGTGTGAVLVTKGKEIRYPAETRLQFTLSRPIEI